MKLLYADSRIKMCIPKLRSTESWRFTALDVLATGRNQELLDLRSGITAVVRCGHNCFGREEDTEHALCSKQTLSAKSCVSDRRGN